MPKSQKSPLDAKTKQITDFFSKKSPSQTSTISGIGSPGGATQKTSAKQDATPRLRSQAKATQGNADSSKSAKTPDSQRVGSGASPSTKAVQAGASPMPPPTKRLRSQSIVSPQRIKQSKRSKNILCDCDYERKMDVDDDSVVYVRSVPSTFPVPVPSLHVTTVNAKEANLSKKQGISFHHSETTAFVPSSVSEERELGSAYLEEKFNTVKGNTNHRQDQGLPPTTDGNNPPPLEIQSQCVPGVPPNLTVDWDMDGGFTGISTSLSRPNTATSITTPPSNDELPAPSASPPELLDEKTRAEQIIQEIKLKARAFAQAQGSSPPTLEIPSPVSSDDDDDDNVGGLAALNFRPSMTFDKSSSKPKRYSLRKPSARVTSDDQKTRLSAPTEPQPLIKRKSLTANPLDALLKEKRTTSTKGGKVSEDRESRLRALADLDLNDDSEDDESLQNTKITMRVIKEDAGNPFIDDKQRQQVWDILEDDEVIESEEEHIRQLGNVGAKLWDSSEACLMSSYDAALPHIEYGGSDPSILMLAQTIADGDYALIHVIMDSDALEVADYADGGENVIGFLIDLALSHRHDTLNLSACRLLSHLLRYLTISMPILLLERIFVLLRVLGAQSSVLERMGWAVRSGQRSISDGERTSVIERLILLIEETARACLLSRGEIPDIIAVLLLIGLEPSISHEIRLHVSHTIHQVCQSVGANCNVEIEVESAVCNKVLNLVQPFSPQNKLFTLNLFASASGRTARVARSVAHSILTDKSTLLPSQYSAFPPLSELLIVLFTISSSSSLRPAGKFEIHDATNYADMASWTFILAIALTDISQYVESGEANKSVASLAASPSKRTPTKEKEGSIIQALHEKLYQIHNRIQDNRAAHLDRSRTKMILFQTAFRVLYQCQTVTQNRKKSGQTIQNYFLRKQLPS